MQGETGGWGNGGHINVSVPLRETEALGGRRESGKQRGLENTEETAKIEVEGFRRSAMASRRMQNSLKYSVSSFVKPNGIGEYYIKSEQQKLDYRFQMGGLRRGAA